MEKEGGVTLLMPSNKMTHQFADRPSFEDRLSHTETGDRTCLTSECGAIARFTFCISITVAGQCRIFAELRCDLYYTSCDVMLSL
jgi:hypothetical protein